MKIEFKNNELGKPPQKYIDDPAALRAKTEEARNDIQANFEKWCEELGTATASGAFMAAFLRFMFMKHGPLAVMNIVNNSEELMHLAVKLNATLGGEDLMKELQKMAGGAPPDEVLAAVRSIIKDLKQKLGPDVKVRVVNMDEMMKNESPPDAFDFRNMMKGGSDAN